MSFFNRENITLKNLTYNELKNLIRYLRRNEGMVGAGSDTYHPEVMVCSTSHIFREMELYFNITFPKRLIETAPLDQAILNILKGSNAKQEPDSGNESI